MTNVFERFAPFIQEFIYRNDWTSLRDIQGRAAEVIFDTDNHLLITSGTASGKTEAAFLPVLSSLHTNPSATVGALYIGPLKALINDQFSRLNDMLQDSGIPVQSWHGDVSNEQKRKFLQRARGVLQITPESLEAILIRHSADLGRLFGDLRFVVIDELHAFIGSDRGRQVLCQLGRLTRYQSRPVRRIGLSATLGEPSIAASWLAGNTNIPVTQIQDEHKSRDIRLGLEFYPALPPNFKGDLLRAEKTADSIQLANLTELASQHDQQFDHMYELSRGKKTLIFANSRGDVEEISAQLRERAQKAKTPDIYHVHHGSVSKQLREAAEEAMTEADKPACTAATVTLELGIDIGYLDQVLQQDATYTVSSFVQRLGRTGRRNNPAQMFFYCTEEPLDNDPSLGEKIPWTLIQAVAIIQLYMEERWIEPPAPAQLPFSLLYHQTMSTIFANTELMPPELAERILTLPPFKNVTQDQFRMLLHHLIAIKHLEVTEIGGLIIGVEGEKIVNNYRFYATFADVEAFQVREGTRNIGTIQMMPAVDDRFRLAGFTWKVIYVDLEHKIIGVQKVTGRANTQWFGDGGDIHDRVVERMRRVLEEDANYAYLHEAAVIRLGQARELAMRHKLYTRDAFRTGDNQWLLMPWCGSRTFDTLVLMLSTKGIKTSTPWSPFYGEASSTQLLTVLQELLHNPPEASELASGLEKEALRINKFDTFVPESLLRTAYEKDHLNVQGVQQTLGTLVSLQQ